jgi:predicted GIY-YIG superfamily endonuclease
MEDALRSPVVRAKQGVGVNSVGRATDGEPQVLMKYTYLLKSLAQPDQHYIGCTSDLRARIEQHNRGRVHHTAKYRPWKIHVAIRFEDDHRAEEFERYLKGGSGHAFAARHLW